MREMSMKKEIDQVNTLRKSEYKPLMDVNADPVN
jgi:hypothetical protein